MKKDFDIVSFLAGIFVITGFIFYALLDFYEMGIQTISDWFFLLFGLVFLYVILRLVTYLSIKLSQKKKEQLMKIPIWIGAIIILYIMIFIVIDTAHLIWFILSFIFNIFFK
ncbi:MAG: hypothetical protein CMI53_03100 [Parcubacteria group bacterium]|nr:hypothetical protein [Parcubacteria group bacterium]|tara:strand:- start:3653 stop:3988 length:336 start_codon:yes stop_codon:yes gene_type:complete